MLTSTSEPRSGEKTPEGAEGREYITAHQKMLRELLSYYAIHVQAESAREFAVSLSPDDESPSEATAELVTVDDDPLPEPFRFVELLVPQRIYDEEVGDALELLDRLEKEGAPQWKLHLKIWSTMFWVVVNAGRELVAAVLGKKKNGA